LKIAEIFSTYWACVAEGWIKFWFGFQFAIAEIRLFYQKLLFEEKSINSDRILWLCLIFENKTDVGPGDNVVQLIKAHSLHTLFAVFEKIRYFQKLDKVIKFCQSRWISSQTIVFDKIIVSQRRQIEIQPKIYPIFSNARPICRKNLSNFQFFEVL
jgi:hypothetical protein